MKLRWWRRRERSDQPDIDKAQSDLARIRAQRPDVEALVASLITERRLNNFTANLTATFRGGRS